MPSLDFEVETNENRQVADITHLAEQLVDSQTTAVSVFVAHTTCGVTTADLDPGTDLDLLDAVWDMIPKAYFRHAHDPAHTPAHLASSIIGPSVTIPVKTGSLVLGEWQRVILVELDGPRTRKVVVTGWS
jgi:secondary thiamine-phosphate synthase enzyme